MKRTFIVTFDEEEEYRSDKLDVISSILMMGTVSLIVYLYITGRLGTLFGIPGNMFAFIAALIAILGKFMIYVYDQSQIYTGWFLKFIIAKNTLTVLIIFILFDIIFDTYFIPFVFGVSKQIDMLIFNIILVFILLIIMGIIWLTAAGIDRENSKAWGAKYVFPIGLIFTGVSGIAVIFSFYNPMGSLIEADLKTYEALHQGQSLYGGADMFVYTITALFYSPVTAIMMAIMFVGTFATIISVNLGGAPALKNFGTVTVVVPPLLLIWSIWIGAVAPPSMFVKILGGESLASMIYAITMVSVFIIFIMINSVFVQAADFFIPEKSQKTS
ncbi:MAG: hypothetical protein ACP6IY_18515 [Promethearchaeia archaeon]